MAVGNVILYRQCVLSMPDGAFGLPSAVCVLLSSSYTPNVNTDKYWSDVSAYEISGTGYTAGGKALVSGALTLAGGAVKFDADDVSWATSTLTAKYAVLVGGTAGSLSPTDRLIGFADLNTGGGSVSSVAAAFTIAWDAAGIFSIHT